MNLNYREIMSAVNKPDVYAGENCDEIKAAEWFGSGEGDKDGDDGISDELILNVNFFPFGTKISVSVPECPDCGETQETCNCGFDWKNWLENEFG